MGGYELGFVGIMGFMVLIAAGALFFVSFDADHTPIQTDEPQRDPQDITARYAAVHQITTDTLETVDLSGVRRRWHVNSEG